MKNKSLRLHIVGAALILSTAILPFAIASQNAADSITEAELRDHIYFLASEAMRGRDTGDIGYENAAKYAASQLLAAGVQPLIPDAENNLTYFQSITMNKASFGPDNSLLLKKNGDSSPLHFGRDYFVITNTTDGREEIQGPLVFAGYGIEDPDKGWNDLEGLDVSGSVPILMMGFPGEKITSAFAGTSPGNAWTTFQSRIKSMESKGAAGIVAVLDPRSMARWDRMASAYTRDRVTVAGSSSQSRFPEATIPVIFLGPESLSALFADRGFDPVTLEGTYSTFHFDETHLNAVIQTQLETLGVPNVVGIVEGSDPQLKEEFIVLGAHLDHVGIQGGEVYNGADDNASGSVGVLEVGEAIAMAPPKRSVIFALFTGEEKGILGSRYFVESPPVPQEKIVANVNIEMIGRWSHRPQGSNEIFAIIGNSEDGTMLGVLNKVNEMGFGYQLDVPEKFTGGSDHVAFQNAGIPNITIAGSPPYGTHEDYHRPGDDAEKIDFAAMRKAAALIYELTMELANRQ